MQYQIYIHSLQVSLVFVFMGTDYWNLKFQPDSKLCISSSCLKNKAWLLHWVRKENQRQPTQFSIYTIQCRFFSINQTLLQLPSTERCTNTLPKSIFLCLRAPSGQNTTTYQILLLFIRRVFSLLNSGNPSSFRISLSEKSIASNWSRVAPKFSITGIL